MVNQNQNQGRVVKSTGTGASDGMTGRTSGWDARTLTVAGSAVPETLPQPSRTALATRSATAAMGLTGDAQRDALRQHFTQFAPAIDSHQVCRTRRR